MQHVQRMQTTQLHTMREQRMVSNYSNVKNRIGKLETVMQDSSTGAYIITSKMDGSWSVGNKKFKSENAALYFIGKQQNRYQKKQPPIIIDDIAATTFTK